MSRFKKASYRAISLILILSVLLSLFSGISATAVDTPYEVKNDTSDIADLTNHLTDIAEVRYTKTNGTLAELTATPSSRFPYINDGDITTQFDGTDSEPAFFDIVSGYDRNSTTIDAIANRYTSGQRYLQIILPLKAKSTITNLLLVTAGTSSNPRTTTAKFEIFAAGSRDELFSNSVLIYDNTASKQQTLNFKFKEGKELKGITYVAMRVYDPSIDWNGLSALGIKNIYTRLKEFNVYGEVEPDTMSVSHNLDDIDLTSFISNVAEIKYTAADGSLRGLTATPSDRFPNINDGDLTTQFMGTYTEPSYFDIADGYNGNSKTMDAIKTAYVDGSRYLQVILPLRGISEISNIVLANGNSSNGSTLAADFEIFASDSLDTLFDNSVVRCNNKEAKKQIYNYQFKAGFLKDVTYVGLRLYDPCCDWKNVAEVHGVKNIYPRINEFNVYGSYVSDKYTVTDSSDGLDTSSSASTEKAKVYFAKDGGKEKLEVDTDKINNNNFDDVFTVEYPLAPFFDLADNFTADSKDVAAIGTKYITKNQRYVDVVLPLSGYTTVSNVLVSSKNAQVEALGVYEIFAADNEEELFNSSNSIAFYNNGTNRTKLQNFAFNEGKEPKDVLFVGMRIYNPISTWNGPEFETFVTENGVASLCANISEFNVYGDVKDTDYRVYYNTDSIDISKTLLFKAPSATFTIDGVETPIGEDLTKMYDYDFTTEYESSYRYAPYFTPAPGYTAEDKTTDAIGEIHNDGSRYMSIVLPLKGEADITDFIVVNAKTKMLMNGHYEIFASTEKNKLWNSENSVVEYDNSAARKIQNIKMNKGRELRNIRFVGIRIYDPQTTWEKSMMQDLVGKNGARIIHPRILEFNVYGSWSDPDFDPNYSNPRDTAEFDLSTLNTLYGDSLIKNLTPTYLVDGKMPKPPIDDTRLKKFKNIFNNSPLNKHEDLNLHVEYWKYGESELDLIFKINGTKEAMQIDGFAYQGVTGTSTNYRTGHYQVYVSMEYEDIFNESSLVYEYSVDEDGMMLGQVYEFETAPVGCYIAFKILDSAYAPTEEILDYPRISCLYVWGKEAILKGEPTNVALNMPINAYFRNGETLTDISDSNLTLDEIAMLTDSNTDSVVTIKANKSTGKTAEFIYNLCNDIDVSKIQVFAELSATAGFSQMKVYGSSSFIGVSDESNLMWTYNAEGSGKISPQMKTKNGTNVRYVRFVFTDVKDYLKLYEIYVEGLDTQMQKSRNLSTTLSAKSISVTKTNLESRKESYIDLDETEALQLFDGISDTYLSIFSDGLVGKDKYDIQISFGDLRTISSLELEFIKNIFDHRPAKINVYASETDGSLEGGELIGSFNPQELKGNSYTLKVRPRLARYLRIELAEFTENPLYETDEGSLICVALSNLKIIGTKVKGMQTSELDNSLITFTDPETEIKLTIVRHDLNDVFTDVVAINVVESEANLAQMRSLAGSSCMIVDKKIYSISMLDIYGNAVADIDGRSIKIGFPVSDNVDQYLIGDSSDSAEVIAQESVGSNGVIWATVKYNDKGLVVVSLLKMTTADDPYWDELGEDIVIGEDVPVDLVDTQYIVTDDNRFTVYGIENEIVSGVKLVATDVSATKSDQEYIDVVSATGNQVAVFYDIEYTLGGSEYIHDGILEYNYQIPMSVSDKYSDLAVVSVTDGDPFYLWSEVQGDSLCFQADANTDFAIVGTLDASAFQEDNIYSDTSEGVSPQTGEDNTAVAAIFALMMAAAYIAIRSSVKSKN